MITDVKSHLENELIPFWMKMKDKVCGGYYGKVDFDLYMDKNAHKGCILNSRILWFFSNAYLLLGKEKLKKEADHAYHFLVSSCLDKEYGGVYWSVKRGGEPEDTTKHTYNQAFAVYALSSYYAASGREEALALAEELFALIEERCTDEIGYLEAFDREFHPAENDKLSENGVIAEKTMNTLLHVLEAYTELYRVGKNEKVADRIRFILDITAQKLYNPEKQRQEVFFDRNMNSILDLHSYGHDIEASWLVDRACEVLGDEAYTEKIRPITRALAEKIYERAFVDHSILNECEKGVDDTTRIWWVQAEGVVGFLNQYEKDPRRIEYLDAAADIWSYIKDHLMDKRSGSEWFWSVDQDGRPDPSKPVVDEWKCPYHNGRMCIEVIRRLTDAA